ncbi:hypothetical protein AB0M38_13225 [Streptomyces sp. NPDC051742]|uniref:hypothetical protein n=1 Tax=unclassified Streptomyces TaxID=2593676 RepID=UPI0034175A70
MTRSENEVDQIVFRWDSENLTGSTGFGPVAWSGPRDEAENLFRTSGPVLRASGEETRPALIRLQRRADVMLIRRTPFADADGGTSVLCHALVGSPALLEPAVCLGLHAWNWEGADLNAAEARGRLPVVPEDVLVPATGRGQGELDRILAYAAEELTGAVAELLRHPDERFTVLDERGDTACQVLWGLHSMFGTLTDRRWTFATHDTVELPALRFVFVGRWSGAASRNTERRRVDPRERSGDAAEEIAARLVRHHLQGVAEGEGGEYAVGSALHAASAARRGPLLDTATRALAALDGRAGTPTVPHVPAQAAGPTGRTPWAPAPGIPGPTERPDLWFRPDPRPDQGPDQGPDPSPDQGPDPSPDPRPGQYGSEPTAVLGAVPQSEPKPKPEPPRIDPTPEPKPEPAPEPTPEPVLRTGPPEPSHRPGGDPYPRPVLPQVAPEWTGPSAAPGRSWPRVRGREKDVETGLAHKLPAARTVEEARGLVERAGSRELLAALGRPQAYVVLTLLLGEAARRLPSWEHPLRRELCAEVLGQDLWAVAPPGAEADPSEPPEEQRAANAAELHLWAVRPVLAGGDGPVGTVAALLSRLRTSPAPSAREAFWLIVEGERPGLPEVVWLTLLKEAYGVPRTAPRPAGGASYR